MEQLENLVKLMEELSELRDQNCMLKKKVQVLENLKQEQPGSRPADVRKDRYSHARATRQGASRHNVHKKFRIF